MNLSNILKTAAPGAMNGKGMMAFVFLCLAKLYGEAKTVETKENNVITAFETAGLFHVFEVERESVKYSVTADGGPDSKSFDVSIEFFIPGMTPEKSHQLEKLVNYPLVGIVQDRLGNIRKAGERYDGLSFSYVEETENSNGYRAKLEAKGMPSTPSFVFSFDIIPKVAEL